MRIQALAAAAIVASMLGGTPALAGLLGQAVTLGGVSAVIGSGVEFAGVNPTTGQAFTADFGDGTLTLSIDNRVTTSSGTGYSIPLYGTPFSFRFAQHIIAGLVYVSGTIAVPVASAPPVGSPCEGLPPGFFCAGFVNGAPQQFETIVSAMPNGIDLALNGGPTLEPVDTATFRIVTVAVPEPASVLLLLAGMVALGGVRRARIGRPARV